MRDWARGERFLPVVRGELGLVRLSQKQVLILVATVTVLARAIALRAEGPAILTPDGARFLNIARCISRGQGFSTPEAWPAWIRPASLPMPETFKEPGYPYAIAALTPLAGGPIRAAQGLSLLAGLLLPFAVYALGRRLDPDPAVAGVAALFAAASPAMIAQSVYIVAESLFTLTVTLMFLAAAAGAAPSQGRGPTASEGAASGPRHPWPLDLLAGALFGLSFLIRAQALLALPALVVLLVIGRRGRAALGGLALVLGPGLVVISPLLVRNLRLFGVPFHSDAAAFGLWPYADPLAFSHRLERPEAPIGYALAHLPQVAAYSLRSLARFGRHTLPKEVLGSFVLLLPLAAGLVLSVRRWRAWGFSHLYVGLSLCLISAVYWAARYFASLVPLVCLWTALGAVWLGRPLAERRIVGAVRGRHVLALALAVLVVLQVDTVRREIPRGYTPELEAARSEARFLRARLEPDESVMVVMTSYWAWFADRPAVHLVIADAPHFAEEVRRLKVRYAALPTSRLDEFAARYPGGRLPAALVPDHEDRRRDVTVFEVRAP